ncbi:MAG: hypothetical protein V3U44_06410, partial [Alphaproteobacteria bacterium]
PGAVPGAARVYFRIGVRFGFDWLRTTVRRIDAQTPWQRQVAQDMMEGLYGLQFRLVNGIMDKPGKAGTPESMVKAWVDTRKEAVEQCEQMLADMRAAGAADIAMMAVAIRQLRLLVRG